MKTLTIYGYDGKKYVVGTSTPLQNIKKWIIPFEGGLKYVGPDLTVVFWVNNTKHSLNISDGFVWDGASIPKGFQWLIGKPTDEAFWLASMFHDDGYGERSKRVINDVIFYYLLMLEGVSHWKADAMYKAVRVGGHAYYASDSSLFWRKIRNLFY